MSDRKVVATTTFTRSRFEKNGQTTDEWTWVTQTNNGEPVANSETFKTVAGALNGFLASQGHTEWTPGQVIPAKFSGFQQSDKTGDVFTIDTYETV